MFNKEINPFIKRLLDTCEPKITNLRAEERKYYRFGLSLLGLLIREDFFDLPRLPDDRFSQDGLFYTIEYFDSDQLWSMGNTRWLLVVYEVRGRSSFCPMSMEFEVKDEKNFSLHLNDQAGGRTVKWLILSCEDGKYYTEISNFSELKLSDLVYYTEKKQKAPENQSKIGEV